MMWLRPSSSFLMLGRLKSGAPTGSILQIHADLSIFSLAWDETSRMEALPINMVLRSSTRVRNWQAIVLVIWTMIRLVSELIIPVSVSLPLTCPPLCRIRNCNMDVEDDLEGYWLHPSVACGAPSSPAQHGQERGQQANQAEGRPGRIWWVQAVVRCPKFVVGGPRPSLFSTSSNPLLGEMVCESIGVSGDDAGSLADSKSTGTETNATTQADASFSSLQVQN